MHEPRVRPFMASLEDRYVTAGELFEYVHDRVGEKTGGGQNPRVLPGANGDLTLAVERGK